MRALGRQVLAEHTDLDQREGLRVEPLSIASASQRRISAYAFGLTFLVLLIACVNLANLQLARTAARGREFAIRGAIGGGKGRLMRQSLTESLVVSLVGGSLAIPLSYWCTRLIASRQFADLPGVRITLEPVTLAFAFGCAVVTGLIFGAVPAWLASRSDINDVLKQNRRAGIEPRTTAFPPGAHRRRDRVCADHPRRLRCRSCAGCSGSPLSIPGGALKAALGTRLAFVGPRYTSPRARRGVLRDAARACREQLPGVTGATVATSGVPVRTVQYQLELDRRARPTGCWPTTSA